MPSWKKVILSGSDAALNSLYVNGPITGSDIQINQWGSVSASLAAINATGSTQNLQQVTDNGSTTTNGISATGGFTGSLQGTASFAVSASHAIFADTASFLPSTTNLNITSISASTATFASASIGYLQTITGSAKIIGDAFIILNNDTPTERYAGIIVQDSGSVLTTASFQYDGQTNDWFYEYSDDGGVTSDHAVAIFGPEYNTKGSPTYLTANIIPKSDGTHHLNDSNLSDNGSRVSSAVSLTVTGSITSSVGFLGNLTGTASFATQALSASYAPGTSQTLQQVTDNGNITFNSIIFTGSQANSLQIVNLGADIPFISVSGSVNGPTPGRLVDVIYNAISANTNSTTTIAQLPAPKVAGFTFDYIAYVSGNVLQAGRAGVVKGILRNTETGVVTKAFQINETTTLDLEDDGEGTAGLQFTIIQDTNGTSNQLVAITDGTWPYTINYTLTIYYNPDFS